jgi:glycosyltransferase involved in cell wall biosynthesis
MKKIIVSGPILSRSGYGEMARLAVASLKNRSDIDLYINATNWGNNGNTLEDSSEVRDINLLIKKTQQLLAQNNNQVHFDVAIQVTIPNEWKRIAPINIGYTAGIETNYISPSWLEPSNTMDKIIVISEHAKKGFVDTVFSNAQGQQFKVSTPTEVVHFPHKDHGTVSLELDLKHDFNFLAVCQWGPRKNLEQTIVGFLEEFKDREIGLVLKVNTTNDSIMDRELCSKRVEQIVSNFPNKKCTVTLIHGYLKESELNSLYTHPKIKAIISTTHGEGYGIPLFEASLSELPVIATDWSGHLDFLIIPDEQGKDKKMFAKIECEIKPIAKEHVWQGVLEEGTSWAYPIMSSYKSRMNEVIKDYPRFKSWAKKLAAYNKKKFDKQKIHDNFFYSLGIFSRPNILEPKAIKGISFCIPTHGKRLEKTNLTIKSIKKQKWGNIPYEIIVCGDVESFAKDSSVKFIDERDAAHSRKVAKLRNKAAKLSSYDVICFCDDDIILSEDWLEKTLAHGKINGWEILGNRVFSPDGTRYWDRSLINPHILADYDHQSNDKSLYQSSAFFLIRKNVFEKVKWDETKLVFADKEGGIPEDLQYSFDLTQNNYEFKFNKDALVWHNDDSYTEFSFNGRSVTQKKEALKKTHNFNFFLPNDDDYESLIYRLNNA